MAAVSSIIAGVALGVGAVSAYQQRKEAKSAQRLMERSAEEERKARATQAAQNTQQQAQEQRQQIREERVRRAQILQGAENTGTSGGSGAMGATGGLSTNLGTNIGINRSAIGAGQRITGFQQNASNFSTQAQRAQYRGNTWGQIGGMGMQVFGAAGGFGTLFGSVGGQTGVGGRLVLGPGEE